MLRGLPVAIKILAWRGVTAAAGLLALMFLALIIKMNRMMKAKTSQRKTMEKGYTLLENYTCDNHSRGESHPNLDAAWNSCNANSQCKCIEHVHSEGVYYTYTSGTPKHQSIIDVWIKN